MTDEPVADEASEPADPGPGLDEPGPESPPPGPPPDAPGDDRPTTGDTSAAQSEPQVTEMEVDRRRIALVLVVDRSASMSESARGAATKMDFAKTSAFETARALERGDELGIVAFGERAHVVRELGPLPSEPELRSDIERLRAVDRATLLADALGQAGRWLGESTAPVRHAVVVTDGEEFDPGDARRAQSAARAMGEAGITVSVVQIASTRAGLVRDVANIAAFGKGTFVRETDGSQIPRLVFTEVARALGAAGRRPTDEQPQQAGDEPAPAEAPPRSDTGPPSVAQDAPERDEPAPDPAETDPTPAPPDPGELRLRVVAVDESRLLEPRPTNGEFPPLSGVTDCTAREGARVLLAVDDGTPLLGFANRGLGRIAAWASDWTGPWSRAWREEPVFPGRLAAWVEAVRPAADTAATDDRLVEQRVEPRGPVSAERATLAALGVASLAPLESFVAPSPRRTTVERGHASEDALFAIVAIVFLAFVEWLARRVAA
jgi:hypothetical protein